MAQSMTDNASQKPDEYLMHAHQNEVYLEEPNWSDVPDLKPGAAEKVCEMTEEELGPIGIHADKRRIVARSLGRQYVRYRRAGCKPQKSRELAIEMVSDENDSNKSAIYNHIQNLPFDELDEDTTYVTPYLEEVFSRYRNDTIELDSDIYNSLVKFASALRTIAEIKEAPEIEPSDISLTDVFYDRPGERDRVLTSERDVTGLPSSESADRRARITGVERFDEEDLIKSIWNNRTVKISNQAKIYPRDLSTYSTEFSQVLRRIFKSITSEMKLFGKQKPDPVISSKGDDNAAIRARLPSPDTDSGEWLGRVSVCYWESGSSDVRISTHPFARIWDEKDPKLRGPIESISEPAIHALIGFTIVIYGEYDKPESQITH